MHRLSHTVAIATLSSRVLSPASRLPHRAGAVGVLRVIEHRHGFTFFCHAYVPRTPTRLSAWLGRQIADDPLLVGYQLARTSRLLMAAGHDLNLANSFALWGRHELLDVMGGQPVPLSHTAAMYGAVAVDEEVLIAAAPIDVAVAANLALVNAVVSWVVHAHQSSLPEHSIDRVMKQLAESLAHVQVPLAAAMFCRTR